MATPVLPPDKGDDQLAADLQRQLILAAQEGAPVVVTVPTKVGDDGYEVDLSDAAKAQSEREIEADHQRRADATDDPHERAWCLARARDARRQATRFSRRVKHSPAPRPPRADHRPRERREQRHTARSTSSSDSGSDPEPADQDGAWSGGFSFAAFDALVSTALPGHIRLRLFYALPDRWHREAWDSLAAGNQRRWAR